MPQINCDIFAFTIFMSMCFVHVLSVNQYQHQNQQRQRRADDEHSSAIAASNDNENSQAPWQPMSQNNWIILKTTARKIAAANENVASNHRHSHSSITATTPEQLKYQYWHKEQQAHPLPAPQLPTNYYTYNQHNNTTNNNNSNNKGYYQQSTATDVKLIEPYIVTISKMRTHHTDSPIRRHHQHWQQRQQHVAVDAVANDAMLSSQRFFHGNVVGHAATFGSTVPYVGAIKLPKDVVGSAIATPPKIEPRQDIKKMYNNTKHNFSNGGSSSSNGISNTMKTSISDDEDIVNKKAHGVVDNHDDADEQNENEQIIDEMKADGAQLNEIYQPLQSTLDKIISFCDMAKRFISNVDASDNDGVDEYGDDEAKDVEENNDDLFNDKRATTSTATQMKPGDDDHKPEEVQGQFVGISMGAPPSSPLSSSSLAQAQSREYTTTARASTTTTDLTAVGTGRKVKKLKKKLSKFILPLLLAYKLKFLTLIPVLIGGLTLLVGTTGLAGFFFALFTAVMSLKSTGSSKAIIVKKI